MQFSALAEVAMGETRAGHNEIEAQMLLQPVEEIGNGSLG
jgi:hypothetical protein